MLKAEKTGNGVLNFLNIINNSFLDFVAPSVCLVCNNVLENSTNRYEFICNRCQDALPLAPSPDVLYNRLQDNFSGDDLSISSITGLLWRQENDKYMKLIYDLKYAGFSRVGIELGTMLGELLKTKGNILFDAIVPVPIHSARRRERGYNQSEMIAMGISKMIGCPVETDFIKRSIYTQTQTTLDKHERRRNVEQVFQLANDKIDISILSILLVDDVLTTGATLNAAATCLMNSGCRRVDAAVLMVA